MTFVHLHTHSHFSLLDGLGKPAEYVRRAAELEQPALALTDHGSLSGLYALWKECQGTGVKPIAGCEFYIAPASRHRKEAVYFGTEDQRKSDVSRSGAYCHITILARDSRGLRSLYRLQHRAYTEGFYNKPRIDLELLDEHKDGLICLTGCPGGIMSTYARIDQDENVRAHASDLKDIFGEWLYVELMSHGISFENKLNEKLVKASEELNIPVVATGDAHYCNPNDSRVHDALLCLQTNSKLADPKFTFDGTGYHLASYDEMATTFAKANLPHTAIEEAAVVAHAVESYDTVFSHQLRMPRSKYSEAGAALVNHSIDGLRQRIPDYSSEYATRLEYELDTLTSLGFSDYFLVVADIVTTAKKRGIPIGPGRGSAGGSLVAYSLGITDLDPLPSKLLFERFVNPERVGLPDIDIDIAEDRREEVLAIAREEYGEGCVASLGTFGTVGAKAALKDSTRVLGYSYRTGEERTWLLPKPKFGKAPTLKEYDGPKDDIYDLALGLEGTVRNEGIHPAGVVISPEPLSPLVPLRRPGGKGDGDVICFDMHEVEALGLVKTDFLGLNTIKVIYDCLEMLAHGELPVPEAKMHLPTVNSKQSSVDASCRLPGGGTLPTDPRECIDPATYELLASGNTLGVFQLDSSGMRGLLRQVAPDSFGDVAAVLALYRPGPMGVKADRDYASRKHGKQRVSSIHPELEKALTPVLSDTYGLIVYQEQVLEALAAVGNYTYASAELIFNAMRKKQHDKMAAARPDFEARMKRNGYSADAITALWNTLVPFADYSFNRSHSVGYAIIAYWCAYLKANHPVEWMAALLSNEDDNNKRNEYLSECSRMGIDILPPDVNESGSSFTPTESGIRYGLYAIKGVGMAAITPIIKKRPFKSLDDWYRRAPAAALNVGVLTALVKSGALDGLAAREGHLEDCEKLAEKARSEREAKRGGQRGLVKARYRVKNKAIKFKQRQTWEKETLGVQLSMTTVTIKPKKPLNTGGMEWLCSTLKRYPGRSPVRLDLGAKTPYDTGCKTDVDAARPTLEALGVDIIEC